ncbi:hypothetical protein CR513_12239, partial [Mucuna pruriens]
MGYRALLENTGLAGTMLASSALKGLCQNSQGWFGGRMSISVCSGAKFDPLLAASNIYRIFKQKSSLHRKWSSPRGSPFLTGSMVLNPAKILPYKHAIVAYGVTIASLPSQIAYGDWQKIHHAILPRHCHLTTLLLNKGWLKERALQLVARNERDPRLHLTSCRTILRCSRGKIEPPIAIRASTMACMHGRNSEIELLQGCVVKFSMKLVRLCMSIRVKEVVDFVPQLPIIGATDDACIP